MEILQRGGYMDIIGKDRFFASETEAIAKIHPKLDTSDCRQCQIPVFSECKGILGAENRK